jgi:hypothetical protein
MAGSSNSDQLRTNQLSEMLSPQIEQAWQDYLTIAKQLHQHVCKLRLHLWGSWLHTATTFGFTLMRAL